MTAGKSQALINSPRQLLTDLLLIGAGSVLCAIGINGILVPQNFVTGGVTGLALICHKLLPSLGLGWIYLLLNIPIFVLAWMVVGRRFFFYSILGVVSLTLALNYIHPEINLNDRMLSGLLAGLINGAGAGCALRSSGSQGGLDVLSVILLQRFSIRLGSTILAMNGLILLLVACFYSLEAVLYTLIVIYVSARVLNLVVVGLSQRKAVFIISRQWREISREILKDIRRGVTLLKGEGGYTGNQEHILYTVVHFGEIGQLKRLVLQIDPGAFVVISDTLEVVNYRIGNQPHW